MANLNEPATSNTKTRTLLIVIGLMVLIGVLVAIYSFKYNKPAQNTAPTSGLPGNMKITPGVKSSEKYIELQQSANMIGTKKAEAKGSTFVPTIVANKSEDSSKNFACQLSSIIDEQDKSDAGKLSKQLAAMLADLMKKNGTIDDLINLLKELLHQGYAITDMEDTSKKLQEDGYNIDQLAKLLQKLKAQGYPVEDMPKMLQNLLKNGYNNPEDINNILDKIQKDKQNKIDDALNQLQDAKLASDQLDELLTQIDNPELQKLISQLANQGYSVDSTGNLLKQLSDRGYDISNPEKLLKQLSKDGYDTAKLLELLDDLKSKGKNVNNLKKFIKDTTKKNKAHTNKSSAEELENILNSPPAISNNLPNVDQEYAALLKKQQENALNEEKIRNREIEKMVNEERALLRSEAQQQAITSMVTNMEAQLNADSINSGKVPTQTFVQGESPKEENNKNNRQENKKGSLLLPGNIPDNSIVIKAGTILFAILETGINSDEPSPILAKIVQAPLKDAKLIGRVQSTSNQYSEKLILNFSSINIPNKIHTYGFSGVAIDPETSRTAIASDVEHHYLLRWGSILAANFLQGYSSGIAQSATTVNSTSNGTMATTTTQTSPLNPRQQTFKGLSEVASSWAEGVKSFTNRPNTITINAGISIGILLTSDFTIPTSDDAPSDLLQQESSPISKEKNLLQETLEKQIETTELQSNNNITTTNKTPITTQIANNVINNTAAQNNTNVTTNKPTTQVVTQTTNNTTNNTK